MTTTKINTTNTKEQSNWLVSAKRMSLNLAALILTVSMAYSSYKIWTGLDSDLSKMLIAPQIAAIIAAVVYVIVKLNKR